MRLLPDARNMPYTDVLNVTVEVGTAGRLFSSGVEGKVTPVTCQVIAFNDHLKCDFTGL